MGTQEIESRTTCRFRGWMAAAWLLIALVGVQSITWAAGAGPNRDEDTRVYTLNELKSEFKRVDAYTKIKLLQDMTTTRYEKDIKNHGGDRFLVAVLKDKVQDPRVRVAAIDAMQKILARDEVFREIFLKSIQDVIVSERNLVLEYALEIAPKLIDPKAIGPSAMMKGAILDLANDKKLRTPGEIRLRALAVESVGRIGDSAQLTALFALMKDPSKDVSASAVKAVDNFISTDAGSKFILTNTGNPNPFQTVLYLIKQKDFPLEGKAALVKVLATHVYNYRLSDKYRKGMLVAGSKDCLKAITDNLSKDSPLYFFRSSIQALGLLSEANSVKLLTDILNHLASDEMKKNQRAQKLREDATEVLGMLISTNIGDGRAANRTVQECKDLLIAMLNDKKDIPEVRTKAAFHLGSIRFRVYGRPELFDLLFQHAFDPGRELKPEEQGQPLLFDDNDKLKVACKQSMEMLADRRFPDDWKDTDYRDWIKKEGLKILKERNP